MCYTAGEGKARGVAQTAGQPRGLLACAIVGAKDTSFATSDNHDWSHSSGRAPRTALSLSPQPCTMQFSLCTPHAMGNNLHHLQTRHVCVALARCMHTGALGLAGLLGTWVDRGVWARDRVHGVRREQTNDYETRRNLQSKLDFAFALIQHAHIHAQPP